MDIYRKTFSRLISYYFTDATLDTDLKNNHPLFLQHRELLQRVFEVLNYPEIKYVFIVLLQRSLLRHPTHLQNTINHLTKAGKKVFLIEDWPSLENNPQDYMSRPYQRFFRSVVMPLKRSEYLNRTKKYFSVLRSMKNATTIYGTSDAFCPDNECLVFSEQGELLYFDSSHLTNAGSELLAKKVLAPYLKEIATSTNQAQ